MRRLISLLFWGYIAVSCAVLWLGAVAVWTLSWPFDRNRRWLHLYSSAWAFHYLLLWPSLELRIEGRERLPAGPAVLAPNHQSLADILVLFGLFHPYKWVSKASVFRVPFVGWNMWMNDYVGLIRGDAASIAQMMDACRRHLDRGVAVLLFPEGTRSRDGDLREFKHGAFTLAVEKRVPVVPIVVEGTSTLLPRSGFVIRSHRVRAVVRVLEPIHPDSVDGGAPALRDLVRARIAAEQAEIRRALAG